MAFNSPAKAVTPLLEVSNLSVAFGKHTAVDAVNFYLAAGEVVVILGANGAGKSTLLKSLGGMVQPHPGAQVSLQGSGITGVPAHLVVEAGVALVPEGRGIFGELSVRENLLLGGFAKRAREELEQNLGQVFSLFPRLQERQAQIARTMSGGEQQMVAIGRALMSKPKVLMLDEPSLGLSPILSKEVFRAIARVAQSGVGVLLVEQNARLSLAIADRGYVMENGRMSAGQPAAAMLQDSGLQRSYLGGAKQAAQGI
ncbi:MAG: ABC transporter ATP-binding protein, partial [Burkholderiaceae bacterium]